MDSDIWDQEVSTQGGSFAPSIKWWEEIEESGKFSRTATEIVPIEAGVGGVQVVFDGGEHLDAWFDHHANAKYKTAKPDGVRCINAMARFLDLDGSSKREVVNKMNERLAKKGTVTFTIENTDQGRLWSFA